MIDHHYDEAVVSAAQNSNAVPATPSAVSFATANVVAALY